MQACTCTPRYENETPESHFLIKDILLSSPTSFIGDPEFSVFSLYPLHFLKSKTGFPIRSPIRSGTSVGNDRFGLFLYR